MTRWVVVVGALLVAIGAAVRVYSQNGAPRGSQPARPLGNRATRPVQPAAFRSNAGPKPAGPPKDRRLLELHHRFLREAAKLAVEYEQGREFDKAKVVYGEMLKLSPTSQSASERLNALLRREANAHAVELAIHANQQWQDTGVELLQGRPVTIRARGKWTFRLDVEIGPEGIQIPEELREYSMGSLIGAIRPITGEKSRPFAIGPHKSFVAPLSGRLFLRMYDVHHQDNEGQIAVEIRGTFLAKDPVKAEVEKNPRKNRSR